MTFRNYVVQQLQIIPLSVFALFIFPFFFIDFLNLYTSSLALLICFCFFLASQVSILASISNTRDQILHELRVSKKLEIFVYFTSVIYLLGIYQNVASSSILDIISNLSATTNAMSKARYSGELQVSVVYKISVILNFASAVVVGSLLVSRRRKPVAIFILVALLDSVLMGARAGFLMMIFTIFVSRKIILVKFNIRRRQSNTQAVVAAFSLIILIVLYFFVVQVMRGGGKVDNLLGILSHILTWFFGYLPAFGIWVDRLHESHTYSLGLYTFYGPLTLMADFERQGGVFLPVDIGNGRITNIFTAFRGLIMDFGLIGAVLVWSLLIALSCYVIAPRRKNKSFLFIGTGILFLSFFSWSFVISIWSYNSVIVGQILGAIILKFFLKVTT